MPRRSPARLTAVFAAGSVSSEFLFPFVAPPIPCTVRIVGAAGVDREFHRRRPTARRRCDELVENVAVDVAGDCDPDRVLGVTDPAFVGVAGEAASEYRHTNPGHGRRPRARNSDRTDPTPSRQRQKDL